MILHGFGCIVVKQSECMKPESSYRRPIVSAANPETTPCSGDCFSFQHNSDSTKCTFRLTVTSHHDEST
ncbi:MAG: hypothetical protein ACOC5R_03880 [Elusimicrobiota bacterium]